MSKCPHCGTKFKFEAENQFIHCEYCGLDFNQSELSNDEKIVKTNKNIIEGKSYSCSQCGTTLLSFDATAVTFCSYCGSQNIVEDKIVKQTAPDYIIPFSKTKDKCIKNYRKQLASFLFAPSYMKDDTLIEKIRGIYIPYGIYKIEYKGECVNRGELCTLSTSYYRYYDDYAIYTDIDASYNGISFDLLSKFYDEYSHAIPFNYKEAVEFNPSYLTGFCADGIDVDSDVYNSDAAKIGTYDSTRFLKKDKIFKKYNCKNPRAKFDVADKKVGMFPVYFLATKSNDGNHLYYAVINGQTGKVAADIPISFPKYIILSFILAIPIFFLLNIGSIIMPKDISIFAIIMSIASLIIYISQISMCNQRDSKSTDKGYSSKFINTNNENDDKNRQNKKTAKFKSDQNQNLKYIIAITLPLATILLDPVDNLFYYVTSSISLLLVILSFNSIIKIHNKLVSRPIPQLEKRDGDESE